jgi:very-short-patch-repair endonuclease
MNSTTTRHALVLYLLLKKMGIPAELEKYDGHKRIDIAVVEAKLNIEVDGRHHNTDHNQALSDLQRTFYSLEKGFYTLRIPNTLLSKHLAETAKYIADIVNLSRGKYNH